MSNIPTLAFVALAITGLALIHETRLRGQRTACSAA